MAKFTYNNIKNISIGHTLFKLNYGCYSWMSYKEKVDSHFKFKSADKLSTDLRELMIICQKTLYHTQKLQKQAHNKRVKP